VWQADRALPVTWPIQASVKMIRERSTIPQQEPIEGWSLWRSYHDEWGAIFRRVDENDPVEDQRAAIWRQLSEQSRPLQGVR
jgi:hypothetical protein